LINCGLWSRYSHTLQMIKVGAAVHRWPAGRRSAAGLRVSG